MLHKRLMNMMSNNDVFNKWLRDSDRWPEMASYWFHSFFYTNGNNAVQQLWVPDNF